MKFLSFVFGIMIWSGLAAADLNLNCVPANINGLNISSLSLAISSEDPEAEMTVQYVGGNVQPPRSMDYEGTSDNYVLTPRTRNDGTLKVALKKAQQTWVATVTDKYVDTFSILACQ